MRVIYLMLLATAGLAALALAAAIGVIISSSMAVTMVTGGTAWQ